jgi:hypothetical protein
MVAPFSSNCDVVVDLAIDAASHAWVTTYAGLFSVDLTTAECTVIKLDGAAYPNSLSFVPAGTLDPAVDALVGYVGATYVRIDPVTGAMTDIGTLGSAAGDLISSGDIVSVKDGGTFLTVTGTGCTDCLLQVDPITGQMLHNYGPINYSAVYGLAFWAGSLYGFAAGGQLFEISANGTGVTTTLIPNSMAQSWYGAGSTTSAPVYDDDGGTIMIN